MKMSVVAATACAACCAAFLFSAYGGAQDRAGEPALRLKAFDAGTGERFVLTIAWESWPYRSDPVHRCRQAAAYLGGEIARRMTIEQVICTPQAREHGDPSE